MFEGLEWAARLSRINARLPTVLQRAGKRTRFFVVVDLAFDYNIPYARSTKSLNRAAISRIDDLALTGD